MSDLKTSWPIFFKPDDRVVALPCWGNPRLYIVSRNGRQRWNDSEFYPAFKPHAKLFKVAIRMLAALGLLPSRKMSVALPNIPGWRAKVSYERMAVLVGVPGPTQKLIARCLDEVGMPVAYIKYGDKPLAVKKIEKEADVLDRLASIDSGRGLAPKKLWRGVCGDGVAMVISAVEGSMLKAKLPKTVDGSPLVVVEEYLKQLRVLEEAYEVDEHPAIQRLCKRLASETKLIANSNLDNILVPLRTQKWPVVIQHGDFTPWNVIRRDTAYVGEQFPPLTNVQLQRSNLLCAIDWEEGACEGFPYFDLLYYILQTGFLIHGHKPYDVAQYAVNLLTRDSLSEQQALALVKLTSLDACVRFASRTGRKAQALQQNRLDLLSLEYNFDRIGDYGDS